MAAFYEITGRRGEGKGSTALSCPSTLYSFQGHPAQDILFISLDRLRLCSAVTGLEFSDWLGDVS